MGILKLYKWLVDHHKDNFYFTKTIGLPLPISPFKGLEITGGEFTPEPLIEVQYDFEQRIFIGLLKPEEFSFHSQFRERQDYYLKHQFESTAIYPFNNDFPQLIPPVIVKAFQKYELKLIAKLLDLAGDEFTNHSCNDFSLKDLSPEDKVDLLKKLAQFNDDPEEEIDSDQEYIQDDVLMYYFSERFEQLSK